jgi:basic membrane protein A
MVKFDHVDKSLDPFHSSTSDIFVNSRLDTAVEQRGI